MATLSSNLRPESISSTLRPESISGYKILTSGTKFSELCPSDFTILSKYFELICTQINPEVVFISKHYIPVMKFSIRNSPDEIHLNILVTDVVNRFNIPIKKRIVIHDMYDSLFEATIYTDTSRTKAEEALTNFFADCIAYHNFKNLPTEKLEKILKTYVMPCEINKIYPTKLHSGFVSLFSVLPNVEGVTNFINLIMAFFNDTTKVHVDSKTTLRCFFTSRPCHEWDFHFELLNDTLVINNKEYYYLRYNIEKPQEFNLQTQNEIIDILCHIFDMAERFHHMKTWEHHKRKEIIYASRVNIKGQLGI